MSARNKAEEILRCNKVEIQEALCADYRLILNKVYANKLISTSEYKNIKSMNKEDVEGHVIALVDKILFKGEKRCQAFLNLLQTDERIKEAFPQLEDLQLNVSVLSPLPVQASSSTDGNENVSPERKNPEQDYLYQLNSPSQCQNQPATDSQGHTLGIKQIDKLKDEDIPESWIPIPSGKSCLAVTIQPGTPEYNEVLNLFQATCKLNVIKIERIQNPTIWKSLQIKKGDMEQRNGHQNNEKRLFHGTSEDNVAFINEYGFNRSYAGRMSACYGNGTYFAVNASYSASNTFSTPNQNMEKFMYLCRVLVGDFALGLQNMIMPPAKGPSSVEKYDSVVDNMAKPSMFVIFNDTQVYPEYLITFKCTLGIKQIDKLKDEDIPESWISIPSGKSCLAVTIQPGTPEYNEVLNLFQASCKLNVIKIERIQNPMIWKSLHLKKRDMEQRNGHQNNEKRLFHGTNADTVAFINEYGFNRSYAGKHASCYGRGTYFAVSASYSASFSTPNQNMERFMYLCKVLVGDFSLGHKNMIMPPAKGPSSVEKYDSVVDHMAKPSTFVIFSDTQAYPEYLITFK